MKSDARFFGVFGQVTRPEATPGRRARLRDTLVKLLTESFRLRAEGAPLSAQLRAQAHADDYMRRLEDSGAFTQRELLDLIHRARSGAWGPATRVLESEDSDARVVAA